mmetsp:Transcript_96121/g.277588  ORF Transcript_96121/g.277588 Transcript_96121/m.277588 type:complete len:246 (+) Transcript_96121:931-1668(+)
MVAGQRQVDGHDRRDPRLPLCRTVRLGRRAIRSHGHGGAAQGRGGAQGHVDLRERGARDDGRGIAWNKPSDHREREQRRHRRGGQDRAHGLHRLGALCRLSVHQPLVVRGAAGGHRCAVGAHWRIHDVAEPWHRLGQLAGGDPLVPDRDRGAVHLFHPHGHRGRHSDGPLPHGLYQGVQGPRHGCVWAVEQGPGVSADLDGDAVGDATWPAAVVRRCEVGKRPPLAPDFAADGDCTRREHGPGEG